MLDLLKEHHVALTSLLHAQREIKTDNLQIGVRMLMSIYVNILQDGISALDSLIQYLSRDT